MMLAGSGNFINFKLAKSCSSGIELAAAAAAAARFANSDHIARARAHKTQFNISLLRSLCLFFGQIIHRRAFFVPEGQRNARVGSHEHELAR